MTGYRTDDITFCSRDKCPIKRCYRHPGNRINKDIPYSVADYENTKFCAKVNKGIDLEEFVVFTGDKSENKELRNKEMAFMRDFGFTFAEIGAKYGLSRQGVQQILARKGRKNTHENKRSKRTKV
jgi:Mor family transcriptional regulator